MPTIVRTLPLVMGCGVMLMAAQASAQDIRTVPRNRTLISQGWDYYNQVPSPTNLGPYTGIILNQRNSLHYTVSESLFYFNMNSGEIIPWQAESYKYNDKFTEVTIKLRDKVQWSDGQPFTADDVVFTFDMLKAVAPDLPLSSAIKEWVGKAEAVDRFNLKITLNKPGPRWVADFLSMGQSTRFVVVPKHIWQGQDAKTFGFFDLAKGWPVGTGPFKVVKSDSGSIIYDRRDKWWAVDAGVAPALPAVERVVYRPATVEATPQLFTNNEIDIGRALQIGAFEAGRARNPGLASWNKSGPVWGAADGCTFRFIFNGQKAPYDSADVRKAINFALNRDQIVDIAYEGSVPKAVLPFASYGGVTAYTSQLQDLVDASGIAKSDSQKVASLLAAQKIAKGADGTWAGADGKPWPVTILMQQGNPIGPVVVQQLKTAGFNAVFQAVSDAAYNDAVNAGNFETALGVHCGSAYDPWQTLEHFHGKYVAAPGQKGPNARALTRYKNPELDQLLDQMEARVPSPQDKDYVKLVRDATAIFVRDLPEIVMAEEFHVVTFNTTYWTGFPTAENPYMAPYIPWEGFNLIVNRLRPTR